MDHRFKDERKPDPREKANLISKFTFGYTTSTFIKGFKQDIEDEDLRAVPTTCQSNKNGNKAESYFEKLKKKGSTPTIYKLLLKRFGLNYFFLGIIHMVYKLVESHFKPTATENVVSFFNPAKNSISQSDAIYYACILIGLKIFDSFYMHNYMVFLYLLAIKIRSSICSLIYRKTLKLSPAALQDVSLGRIVTLITKDVVTFEHTIWVINELWVSVIQTCYVCFLIYRRLGLYSLLGIACLLIVIPVQLILGNIIKNLRMKINKKTDTRLQTTQETLSAIKIIKMYTWELYFQDEISAARRKEVNLMLLSFYLKMVTIITGVLSSKVGFYILVMIYIWMGEHMSAQLLFYVESHFNTLRHSIGVIIPLGLGRAADVIAAMSRINKMLQAEELPQNTEHEQPVDHPQITFNKAFVLVKDKAILHNVSLELKPGLNIVTGGLGSGKSSLLKTILKDFVVNSGYVMSEGRISYASQDPWLFPSSIRQNILFGQKWNEKRYNEIVRVCALQFDFNMFDQGDETVVSDRGLNMSKGQQARINLARAIYKDSDIYLLDDSLTALDSRVQEYIFKQCIQGFLKNKLVIFITHNAKHINASDNVIVMDMGEVKYYGPPQEIQSKELLQVIEDPPEKQAKEEEADENTHLLEDPKTPGNIYHEIKKKGSVNFDVYLRYFRYGGSIFSLLVILILFGAGQFTDSFSNKLISEWSNGQQYILTAIENNDTSNSNYTMVVEKTDRKLNMWTIMIFSCTVLELIKYFVFLNFTRIASIKLHKKMIVTVVNSVMSFFDSYFIGNILNRFSQDMNMIDETLPFILTQFLRVICALIGTGFLIINVNLKFLLALLICLAAMIIVRFLYIPTSRSLKRLESAMRSPIIGHLNASLDGLTTIRAYRAQKILCNEFDKHLDMYSSANFSALCSKCAFGFYMELITSKLFAFVIISVFFMYDTSAGDVGLAITQCMTISSVLQWGVNIWSELENNMTSVERALEYTTLEQEDKKGEVVPNWPKQGTVVFEKVSLRYHVDYVLKDVSFSLAPKEKIGIVGRTGAGKSTIISVLFKLYEFEGRVIIDGVDTKSLSMDFLRQSIAIIPQDPVLFAGTIRSNIDPFSKYTDDEVWQALKRANVGDIIPSLDLVVTDNDSKFSTGQRQLICLARAVIRKNKIVVLDEATANMDPATEELIQQTIQDNFAECTVFTIAHRLKSVMDCNKVLVLDRGQILQLDSPIKLLEDTEGTFYKMVQHAGLLPQKE